MAILIGSVSFSHSQSPEKAYEVDDKILGLGVSFGYFRYYGKYVSASIPLIAHGEYAFHDYVSVGVFFGYQNYKYTDTYNEGSPPYTKVQYTYLYSVVAIGAKGSFHIFPYVNDRWNTGIDDSMMDAYATAFVGYSIHVYKEVTNTGYSEYDKLNNRPVFGPAIGFRYMFVPQVGAFAEAGVGPLGFTSAGVIFNL